MKSNHLLAERMMNKLPERTHRGRRLRLALEAAGMGYWEWHPQTNQVIWSGHTEKIFGLAPGEFNGTYQFFMDLVHPADRASLQQEINQAIEQRTQYCPEYRIIKPNGEIRWLASRGRAYYDKTNKVSVMLGIIRDITGRKRTEEALRQAEQLNQKVLDSIPAHIAVLDRIGNIVSVNRAWQDFAHSNTEGQLTEKNGVGTNYLKICESATGPNSGGAEVVCEKIKEVLSGNLDNFSLEYPCHSPTEERWFLMQVTPLSRERGGAVITHLDITDRKRNEAERARLLAEAQIAREIAEAANRAKDEFIAQITHDLRSPLNAILGWAKVLRTRSLDEQIMAEALSTIEKSAEKQRHMIEDLLDVSRIVTGRLRLDVRPVSLSAVIHSAMEVMRPACEAKEIDCQTELATDSDAITGDPARLEQVIWNVVSNAVKFTPNRGQVKVRLERADPYVQITITDTGKGVLPEHLPHIFDRYWQSANAENRRTGGLGLGLSLTRHIVELHGGTVRAESEGEGKGTKIIITLPYRAVRLQNQSLDSRAPSSPTINPFVPTQHTQLVSSTLSGLLALVVDDEPDARELVAAILRQHGAEVIVAASAAEAFQIIQDSARLPNLLVSDISMPGQDGYSLIQKVRALPPIRGGQIPAIALTAYGRLEDRIRVLSAGFQMHVPKPVEPAELTLIAANLTGRETQHFNF